MPRTYSEVVIKQLSSKSFNRCAFPGCTSPIVELDNIVSGEICHIAAANKAGPRYDPTQTAQQRNGVDNLIMLCGRHHKVIDSDTATYTVEKLRLMKSTHESSPQSKIAEFTALKALLTWYAKPKVVRQTMINSPGAIQGAIIQVKVQKGQLPKFNPATDSIGASAHHRNYVLHLINRSNEFASKQKGREFGHGALYGIINRTFGAKWDLNSIDHFDELCLFLQGRINNTIIGKQNRAQGIRNYSSFEEFKRRGLK